MIVIEKFSEVVAMIVVLLTSEPETGKVFFSEK